MSNPENPDNDAFTLNDALLDVSKLTDDLLNAASPDLLKRAKQNSTFAESCLMSAEWTTRMVGVHAVSSTIAPTDDKVAHYCALASNEHVYVVKMLWIMYLNALIDSEWAKPIASAFLLIAKDTDQDNRSRDMALRFLINKLSSDVNPNAEHRMQITIDVRDSLAAQWWFEHIAAKIDSL